MSKSHKQQYSANFRPTTGKVRESLFNILYSELRDFSEYNFLDCFAGSGQVSIDASLKQFRQVTCLEYNPKHIAIIKQNIQKYKLSNIQVQKTDLFKSNIKLSTQYNIIFADPPYDCELDKLILFLENISQYLQPDGILILEFASKYINQVKDKLSNTSLQLYKEKSYGTSSLLFLVSK